MQAVRQHIAKIDDVHNIVASLGYRNEGSSSRPSVDPVLRSWSSQGNELLKRDGRDGMSARRMPVFRVVQNCNDSHSVFSFQLIGGRPCGLTYGDWKERVAQASGGHRILSHEECAAIRARENEVNPWSETRN